MTSQSRLQTITMPILPDISRGKGNRTNEIWSVSRVKYEKIFSWKILHEMWDQIPRPLSQNWTYIWINSLKFNKIYFCCMCKHGEVNEYQNILKTFCMIFEEKYFSHYILLTDQISLLSLSDCLYFLRYQAYIYCNYVPNEDAINF